ncbi:MAG: hypothetical protein ACR652_07680 [Methylocystis sp.]|uniref:hypothetical protein n=1 Tax=Methylocystis sp. TaxID=1911079 RepID=UPI003DA61EEF
MADPLSAAIERHKTARAAIEAHTGPDDVPQELVDAETAALDTLARTPCADDAEFFSKLAYLLSVQKALWGASWATSYAEEILTAIDIHLTTRGQP